MSKITISKDYTSAALFTNEASNGATTATDIGLYRYNEVAFWATSDTGLAAFTASITAEISVTGTTYVPYGGFIAANAIDNSGTAGITIATAGSSVFSMKNIGGIHSIRFTLTLANVNPSTSVNLFYSGRNRDPS